MSFMINFCCHFALGLWKSAVHRCYHHHPSALPLPLHITLSAITCNSQALVPVPSTIIQGWAFLTLLHLGCRRWCKVVLHFQPEITDLENTERALFTLNGQQMCGSNTGRTSSFSFSIMTSVPRATTTLRNPSCGWPGNLLAIPTWSS